LWELNFFVSLALAPIYPDFSRYFEISILTLSNLSGTSAATFSQHNSSLSSQNQVPRFQEPRQ